MLLNRVILPIPPAILHDGDHPQYPVISPKLGLSSLPVVSTLSRVSTVLQLEVGT